MRTIAKPRNEIYAKLPKKTYATDKTDVYYINDTWSMAFLDLNKKGSRFIEDYRYFLAVMAENSEID